jgi:hypothetical protein
MMSTSTGYEAIGLSIFIVFVILLISISFKVFSDL